MIIEMSGVVDLDLIVVVGESCVVIVEICLLVGSFVVVIDVKVGEIYYVIVDFWGAVFNIFDLVVICCMFFCGAVVCGDDGCGGSCGECGEEEGCVDG